jgi:hypothetical protein
MDKYFVQIRKCFAGLLTGYGFTVVQEIVVDFCDNRFVLLESDSFLISLERDRGYTCVRLARPPAKEWHPDNLYSGDWCSLSIVLAYLGIEEPALPQEPKKRFSFFRPPENREEKVLFHAARQIEQYYPQLRELYLSMEITLKLMDFRHEYWRQFNGR